MIELKCQCCGHSETFENGEAAFQAGWDAPPHFTGYITCNICPAVCIILGVGHTKAHTHWAEHGRPETFGTLCMTDKDWGITQTELDERIEGVKAWIDKLKTDGIEQ